MVLIIVSCSKESSVPVANTNEYLSDAVLKDLTLKQFMATKNAESQHKFFEHAVITDNTKFFKLFNSQMQGLNVEKSKIKFKWSRTENGCQDAIGLCIIISFRQAGDNSYVEIPASIIDGKLFLLFPDNISSNFGLTQDGYLPIPDDILLPSDITNDGSISGTHYVASGIYTANYDSNTNRYIGVVLNIE